MSEPSAGTYWWVFIPQQGGYQCRVAEVLEVGRKRMRVRPFINGKLAKPRSIPMDDWAEEATKVDVKRFS